MIDSNLLQNRKMFHFIIKLTKKDIYVNKHLISIS